MTEFPTLYKMTNTGAIQQWTIGVVVNPDRSTAYDVVTIYGQLGGKLQRTEDGIFEGKNIGRSNETSIEQQAIAEARAKWEKQLKKGYVDSIEKADAGELDELIEGGIVPMLAFTFEKQGHKIKYPCYVQPKLDGIRCIAIVKNGKCTLWSRTRKPITSCPHIIEEIEMSFLNQSIVLDGELYNHDFKENFEHIVHLVRQEEPDAQCKDVQYHIYDMANGGPFADRARSLKEFESTKPFHYIKFVTTEIINSENEVTDYYNDFKYEGYEGAILRNANGLYVHKRSSDLIKVKEMQDARV